MAGDRDGPADSGDCSGRLAAETLFGAVRLGRGAKGSRGRFSVVEAANPSWLSDGGAVVPLLTGLTKLGVANPSWPSDGGLGIAELPALIPAQRSSLSSMWFPAVPFCEGLSHPKSTAEGLRFVGIVSPRASNSVARPDGGLVRGFWAPFSISLPSSTPVPVFSLGPLLAPALSCGGNLDRFLLVLGGPQPTDDHHAEHHEEDDNQRQTDRHLPTKTRSEGSRILGWAATPPQMGYPAYRLVRRQRVGAAPYLNLGTILRRRITVILLRVASILDRSTAVFFGELVWVVVVFAHHASLRTGNNVTYCIGRNR